MTVHLILETFTSETDRKGNRYHHGVVTRVSDGASFHIRHMGGDSNLSFMFSNMGVKYAEKHCSNHTVSKTTIRQMDKTGHMEHVGKLLAWHWLPSDIALVLLTKRLMEWCKTIEQSVEIENDGNATDSYRLSWERHGDNARQEIQELCNAHGFKVTWPGIHAHIDPLGFTLNECTSEALARRILATIPTVKG